ncbi:hypothetical protein BKA57DRAFT_538332 [Linnemannia elongata]|nr:hypothetical protein BKA57DRAFT_538332 [Linnemannia elongata]
MSTTETSRSVLPSSRLLFLPEIIEILTVSLAPQDLFRCIQVCHAWYTLFTPYMYISINDHRHKWPKVLERFYLPQTTPNDQDEDWHLNLFRKHGRHIRHLQANWCVTLNALAAAQTCTQLETLSVPGQSWSRTRPEMVDSVIWRPPGLTNLSNETNLRTCDQHLRIRGRWLYLLVQQNRRTLQELKVLQLSKIEELDPGALGGLLQSCLRLHRLEISDREWGDAAQTYIPSLVEDVPQIQHFIDGSMRWNKSLLKASLPNLKTLGLGAPVPIRAVFQLLKNLPHLQELRMRWNQSPKLSRHDLGAILDHTPHRLERLNIVGIGFVNDDYLAKDILPWLPHLIDLSTQHIGPALAELIPTCYRNLRSYNQPIPVNSICPKYSLPHSRINTLSILLENCPHLVEFDGIEHKIEADYLLDHPWVCKDLEVLRFQIVGVHRLSEEEDMDYRQGKLFLRINKNLVEKEREAIEKHERLQVQQRRVYDRLAEMVHLRVLDLGMEYRNISLPSGRPLIRYGVHVYEDYGRPIPDTLELSLESGLDRLSTLRELEVVGFEGVDHRIEYSELRWMGQSWPRLKEMRGLQEVKCENLRPDETSYLRAFMMHHYPNVKHKRKERFPRTHT